MYYIIGRLINHIYTAHTCRCVHIIMCEKKQTLFLDVERQTNKGNSQFDMSFFYRCFVLSGSIIGKTSADPSAQTKNLSNTKTHHICLIKFDKHPKSSLNISTCSGWEVPSCVPKVWNNKKTLGFSQTTWIPWASRCCWHSEHLVCHNASGSWKWVRQPNHYKHPTHNTQITYLLPLHLLHQTYKFLLTLTYPEIIHEGRILFSSQQPLRSSTFMS